MSHDDPSLPAGGDAPLDDRVPFTVEPPGASAPADDFGASDQNEFVGLPPNGHPVNGDLSQAPLDDGRYVPVRVDRRVVLAGLLIAGASVLLLLVLFSGGDDAGPGPDAPRPTTAAPEFIERQTDDGAGSLEAEPPVYGDALADPYGYADPYAYGVAEPYAGSPSTDYAATRPTPAPVSASGGVGRTPAPSRRSGRDTDPLEASFQRAIGSPLLVGTGAPVRPQDGRPEMPEGLSPEAEQEIYELQAIAAALAPPSTSTAPPPTGPVTNTVSGPVVVDVPPPAQSGDTSIRPGAGSRQAFRERTSALGPTAYAVQAERPQHSLVLSAGTVVPAALVTGISSELPGAVVAQVTRNVYDSRTQRDVLIPAGSRLIGEYDDQVAYGQNRALVAWTRLLFPDGRSVSLPGLPTQDLQGQAGLRDRVDRHTGRLFGSAVMLAAVGAGVELAAPSDGGAFGSESPQQTAARQIAIELSRVATEVIRRDLDVQPTVTIRPGFRFYVFLARDLAFAAPYRQRGDVGRFSRARVPAAR
ncbi:TrbI/VirB10 family protein [Rubrivirga litoralis]|uniref:TrbI/VirB10 family protein n=1 Tax=Rubrivirga litoralis TaxID=3075598 RepID=A0ABU3BRR4_9BACT|nr:TrbI/VirB10 family protein [Rubrivirga sp. F394]MDT0631981.1 TrbI/VirB10 family protein [Rubrivirga sp. F394]